MTTICGNRTTLHVHLLLLILRAHEYPFVDSRFVLCSVSVAQRVHIGILIIRIALAVLFISLLIGQATLFDRMVAVYCV